MKLTTLILTALLGSTLISPALLAGPGGSKPAPKGSQEDFRAQSGREETRQGTRKSAILIERDGSQGDVVHYVDHDGVAIWGGDILLNVDEHGYAAIQRSRLEEIAGTKSAGRTSVSSLWPDGVIPYKVDPIFSSSVSYARQLDSIKNAMKAWESETQIDFIYRPNAEDEFEDYLYVTSSTQCSSFIGRQGGEQNINLRGCSSHVLLHELGHAIGFYHEHTRPDRDEYIEIYWDNIDPEDLADFEIYSDPDGQNLGSYDLSSIMHGGCWDSSQNEGLTLVPDVHRYQDDGLPVDPTQTWTQIQVLCNSVMGQLDELSAGDIEGTARLYHDFEITAINNSGGASQGEVLYQIDAAVAETDELGGLYGATDCISDLDYWGPTILVGVDCANSFGAGSQLVVIEPFGFTWSIAPLSNGRTATSIAFDPTSDQLYAINQMGTGYGSLLYTIDVLTGETTDIGWLRGDLTDATSIDFNEDGVLYAINNSWDGGGRGNVLFTIDTLTAETTAIGALKGDRRQATSIRFGPHDRLYGIDFSGSSGAGRVLFWLDPEDASTRDIGTLTGDRTHATSIAIPGS